METYNTPCNRLQNLRLLLSEISQAPNNHDLRANFFPRFMLAARIRDQFWLVHWTDSLCWDCTEKNRSTKEVFPHLDQRLWQHFGLKQLKHTIHDVFPAFPENISMAMSQCKQSSCRLLCLQIFTKCNWKTFTSLKYDENFNKHAEKNTFNCVKQVDHLQNVRTFIFFSQS